MDKRSRSLPRPASFPTDGSPELHNVLSRFSPVQRVVKGRRVLYLAFCPLHSSPMSALAISTSAVSLCCNGNHRCGLREERAICAAIEITTQDQAHVARPATGGARE